MLRHSCSCCYTLYLYFWFRLYIPMLGPFAYDMYFSVMSDFYLYDLSSVICLYLNCLSYVSYYNDSKVSTQTAIWSTVVGGRKSKVVAWSDQELAGSSDSRPQHLKFSDSGKRQWQSSVPCKAQIRIRASERNLNRGDRPKVVGLYVAAAVVGTCHDSVVGGSGQGMIRSELQILADITMCIDRRSN